MKKVVSQKYLAVHGRLASRGFTLHLIIIDADLSDMEELLRLEDPRKQQLVRIYPKYVRLRQGSEIRYRLKLTRPPSKGKGVTIHVRVIMNKSGITALPTQLVVTSKDWRQTREITVTSTAESELRTFQIHHKINETYDEVYNATALLPSLFVSVLQKEATFLFGFGCGIDGRLGTNEDTNTTTPTPFSSRWLHPLQLACGKAHSAIVDVYSNLYCFGLGLTGQLGQGDGMLESSQEPMRVSQLTSTCVQAVACGSNHTLCMSVDGRVFAWGDNSFGQLGMGLKSIQPVSTPYRVDRLVSVRGIACGGGQSFILTKTNLLACGSNVGGQLGLGDRIDRSSFEYIPFFRKIHVVVDPLAESSRQSWPEEAEVETTSEDVEISCGMYHTLALSGGLVFSWGIGDDGRLGHGNHESCLVPTCINSLKDIPVTSVACGGSHSGVVAADGEVFTWGNGALGQLGLGKTRSRCVPTRVQVLQDKGVSSLSFGEWHSMALCEDGTLFAWGFGEEGQLGLPDADLEPTRRVALLPVAVHALSGTGATMVACGGSHTFVVTVQENRRQQLAQLHRRATQLNVQLEEQRSAGTPTLERQLSKRMAYDRRASDRAITSNSIQQGSSARGQATDCLGSRRCHSARRAEPCPQPVDAAVADNFSWRSRPLSSRLSVRNAFRQQNREMEEWRDTMTPPEVLPPRPRSRHGVSPRLLRLSEQLGRRRKPAEIPAVTQAVADAVHAATQNCLRQGKVGLCMEGAKAPRREDVLDLDDFTYGVRVDSPRCESDIDNTEDSEEISLFTATSRFDNCRAMEADIWARYSGLSK